MSNRFISKINALLIIVGFFVMPIFSALLGIFGLVIGSTILGLGWILLGVHFIEKLNKCEQL